MEKLTILTLAAVIIIAVLGIVIIYKGPGKAFEIIVKKPVVEEKFCCCISPFGTLREARLERYYSCKDRCKLVGEFYAEGKCPE